MQNLYRAVLLILGALLLCWVAIYNGFPLVYSDTGTYLESGFTLETPLDRPIMYGLLLRLTSLNGISAWSVVFLQCLLIAWVIRETIQLMFPDVQSEKVFTATILTLALLTGLPVVSGQLIADIYTSITILLLFILLFGKHKKTKLILLTTLLFIACASHISHVLTCIALTTLVFLTRWIRKRKQLPVIAAPKIFILTLTVPLAALLTMSSSISKSRHVFMMGHLVETGILNAYLDDHCGIREISLCKYRDRIPPGAETFIWNSDGDSVLILTGGWLGTKDEYSQIISETFSEWKYIKMHLKAAVSGTIRQLYWIRVGEGLGVYDSTFNVTRRIAKYLPDSNTAYLSSRQSHDEFAESPVLDLINKAATILSLVLIALWWLKRGRTSDALLLKTFLALTLSAYVINCALCATLATVANRFGARISWMIVFAAVLCVIDYLHNRKRRSQVSN